ncbi:MAG: thermonuclease family protein [Solirubrobacterales bacterium]|nr:thermonuclease family protein [Solirubrobacterales bacterium]
MSTRTALFWLSVLAAVVFAGGSLNIGFGDGGSRQTGRSGHGGAPAGGLAVTAGQTVRARVIRVVDGDTVHVSASGAEETVRYIGVDTPESVKPNTPVQCYAKAASHRNEELVDGEAVRLVVGEEPRDRYGRLLAYVYRTADDRFVNAELVAGGFARTLTIPPNVRYRVRFAALADAARQARRGLWGRC